MDLSLVLSVSIGSLILAGYYVVQALGLNLIYGVLRRINFAHGDFAMVGAFTLYWLWYLYSIDILVSAAIVIVILFVVGIGVYLLLNKPISRADDPEMTSLMVFYGVSLFLSSSSLLVWGADIRGISTSFAGSYLVLLGSKIPTAWILGSGIGAICTVLTFVFLYKSKIGRQIRAVMQNREEAELAGINSSKVMTATFGLGFAFIGVFSAIQPFIFPSIYAKMGLMITITAFIITIIGGLGNPLGTVIGGVIYSITYSISVLVVGAGLAPLLVLLLMLGILYVGKGGILK